MKTITHPAGNWLPATKNYALLFGLIFTICTSVFGEEPNQQWVARYNGPGNGDDSARAMEINLYGSVYLYVTGYSTGSGTDSDYATVKYDTNGNQLWAARYNGPGNMGDMANALKVKSSGSADVYVTGESVGDGTFYDYATIKYSSDGNQLWVARYNGPGNNDDGAHALAVDIYGYAYVTGRSNGSGTNSDYATIKYSPDGNQLWVARYNGPGNSWDRALSIAVNWPAGNVYVTGYSYDTNGTSDYATIKYSPDGNQLWVARYNGPGNSSDYAEALAVDNSGNVYVTGYSTGSGTDVDYATVKYGPGGNQLWVMRYNGPGNGYDSAFALLVDNSGNRDVYVTGRSYGSGTNFDYATVRYDNSGNQLWVKRYNGPGNNSDEAYALALDGARNVYVTGESWGTGTSWDYATVKYNPDGNQLWVARYNGPGDGNDYPYALKVFWDSVYVAGASPGSGTGYDYATIKYNIEQPSYIYVDANATGLNDGTSWANAFKYLKNALWVADSGTEIWVAQGTYRPDEDSANPTGTNSRLDTFSLENGVAIYGGFPSGGGNWASRNPGVYKTILSGVIGFSGAEDNSYVVVAGFSTDSTAILDGFTITGGYNDCVEEPYWGCGGGMYNNNASPTVTNCTFIDNWAWLGGGMSNNGISPTVTNCTFIANSAPDGLGGGMYNYNTSPTLTNCNFSGNSADLGGGIFNDTDSSPTLINCTFCDNSTNASGGGMCNFYNSNPTVTNCIFWGNTGEQIFNDGSYPDVSYCDVQGGWSGTGNINANPLFVDADGPDNIVGTEDDNLRLSAGSPCIDAGDNNSVPEGIVTDLDGRLRFKDDPAKSDTGHGTPPIVDMGPYEYRLLIYVDASATGANNGSSWANAYKYLKNALWSAGSGTDIWIAQGTYKPDEDTFNPSGTGIRTDNFHLGNGVALYGGFPSGGGWANRDPNSHQTILSGDIGVADNNSDNSYHVVIGSSTDSNGILDGFTITAGNANYPSLYHYGGGMFITNGSPTVTNCTFTGNWAYSGGGIYDYNASPTLTNCTFSSNLATWNGGGIYTQKGSPTVTNCTFSGNSAMWNGGGMFNQEGSPTVTNCTFSGNSALSALRAGGGMFNDINGSPTVTNCTFSGNSAYYGGGIFINNDSSAPTVTNCTFSGNSALSWGGGIGCSFSTLTFNDCNFNGNSAQTGSGIYTYGTSIINIGVGGSNSTVDEFYISGSRIQGTGSIVIELGGKMIIDSGAVVDLNDPTDPNVKGTIQCDGLLKVKGNGKLNHATVNVSRQAGGYFGKFQVEDSAQATNLDIHTDGDRFMDVNSATFTGTITNNRIYVTITEGQNGSTEGILEVKGLELPSHPCDFNDPNIRACQLSSGTMPAFDTNSWTLERLEIAAGAKVTLMNRFSSGNDPEVSYAKNLVLGAGCVLNVGMEHLFYTNLTGDSNSIKRDAQLGFSLDVIDCDSNEEFQSRVGNNNYIDPVDPCLNRIQVERVTGLDLDPNGIMKMTNLENEDGNVIYARAKAKFAPSSEDKIRIKFNYMFNTSDPCAQIVVYLSDVAELGDLNDANNYIEVARISNPPSPRPGSAGSGRFADFDKYVDTNGLNLSQGTWVELELIEPSAGGLFAKNMHSTNSGEGHASASIDNWDAQVSCYSCGICLDLDSDCKVLPADFLIVVSGTGSANTPTCVEGGFSNDGYTDTYDTPSWDWTLNDSDREGRSCGEVALSGGGGFPASGSNNPLNLTGLNNLLISGKRGDTDDAIKMKDRLYVFGSNYDYKQYIGLEPDDRCNFRIVRGQGSVLYQINSEKGLLRLDTGAQVVPPGQIPCDINEPRFNLPAEVYAGIGGTDSAPYGRPILDAAFDANFVYVLPVVVMPEGKEPYAAAAKLQLNPYYGVVKLYDGPLDGYDYNNPQYQVQYRNSLREIELDSAGNVYVTNANKMNASDILWKFEPNGTVRRLDLDPCDPCSPRVRAPAGMCVSSATNMLYIASALHSQTDPDFTVIRGFSTATLALCRTITVSGMHHVTSITEDPVSNALWVAGFNLNSNHAPMPFYDPYLANVPLGINDVNALYISGADYDLAMPLSICWTGALPAPELCGGADLNGNGTVNMRDLAILARHWLNSNCGAPNNPCEGADLEPESSPDGDVDIRDLDILAHNWLNTNCQ